MNDLWKRAISTKTRNAYNTGFECFKTFLNLNNIPCQLHLPSVSEDILIYFVAHCHKHLSLKHCTIKLYLCGIRFNYLAAGYMNPLESDTGKEFHRLKTIMSAIKKCNQTRKNVRLPITFNILDKLIKRLKRGYQSQHTDALLAAVYSTAFFGFLRCGEITCDNISTFDPSIHITNNDLKFEEGRVSLKLKISKTDPFRKGISIQLFSSGDTTCPVNAIKAYLSIRDKKHEGNNKPLFVMLDGSPITREYFITELKCLLTSIGIDAQQYSGHSFRMGGATSAATARIEDHLIKTLGRWSSDCYTRYIHTPASVIKNAQMSLIQRN